MQRTYYVAAALLASLLTSGCAQRVYEKPGASAYDFDHDQTVCRYQAVASTASGGNFGMSTAIGAGIAQGLKQAELEDLCLQAGGYRAADKPTPAHLAIPLWSPPMSLDQSRRPTSPRQNLRAPAVAAAALAAMFVCGATTASATEYPKRFEVVRDAKGREVATVECSGSSSECVIRVRRDNQDENSTGSGLSRLLGLDQRISDVILSWH